MSNVGEILSSLGYSLADKGREYRCLPLYRESDDPTVLKIKKDTGEWYDFKLCIGGKLESLIASKLFLSISFPQLIDLLYRYIVYYVHYI